MRLASIGAPHREEVNAVPALELFEQMPERAISITAPATAHTWPGLIRMPAEAGHVRPAPARRKKLPKLG